MIQWLLRFPEFAEYNESSVVWGKSCVQSVNFAPQGLETSFSVHGQILAISWLNVSTKSLGQGELCRNLYFTKDWSKYQKVKVKISLQDIL